MNHHPRFLAVDLEVVHREIAQHDAALRRHGIALTVFIAAAIVALGAAYLAARQGITLHVPR